MKTYIIRTVLLAVILNCFSNYVLAGYYGDPNPTPNPPSGSGGDQENSDGPCAGDPINLINGAYLSADIDLVVKGRIQNIVIKRNYISLDTAKVRMSPGPYTGDIYYQGYTYNWTAPPEAQNVWTSEDGKILECTFNDSGAYQFILTVRKPFSCGYSDEGGGCYYSYPYNVDYSIKAKATSFGNGWDLNYNIRLDEITTNKIMLFKGDNTPYLFIKVPDSNPVEYKPQGHSIDTIKLVKNTDNTYTIEKKLNEKWEFNSTGQITAIKDRNNNCMSFNYTGGKLTGITDDLGNTVILSYNSTTGLLETIADASGRQVSYNYEENGDLISVTRPATPDYPDGLTTTYTYDDEHRLLTIQDPNDDIYLENTYTNGKVTKQRYGYTGQEYSLYYSARKTLVTDRKGNMTAYNYNFSRQLTSKMVYGEFGSPTTSYKYNSDKNIDEIKLPKENKIKYEYDIYRNVSSIKQFQDASSITTLYSYDNKGFLQTYTDPRNNQMSFTYDYEDPLYGTNFGNLMKITLPGVMNENDTYIIPEYRFTYNSYGQTAEIQLPDNRIIKYEYGISGNNNGRITKITYDYGTGGALNLEYQFSYDSYGNINTVTKPDNTSISLDYNALKQLTQIQDELGRVTKYRYNENGKLAKIHRQLGSSYSDETAQVWQYRYDILDKLVEVTNPMGHITEIERDNNDNISAVIDPEGKDASPQYSTVYTYNVRDLLTSIIDAQGSQTTYGYDKNGNLEWAEDDNNKRTSYFYDFADRCWKIEYPDSTYEQYTYDSSSNIIQEIKRDGTVITYTYDGLNRQTSKQIGSGTITYYKYDILGRLRYVKEGSTTVASYNYDRIGRLTSAADSYGKTVGYEYNNNSLRTKLIYPDNSYITYEYYANGMVHYIKDSSGNPIVTFEWDELNRIKKLTYANGKYEEFDYEDAGAGDDNKGLYIKQISYSASAFHSYNYIRDKAGNITQKIYGSSATVYSYDNIYQLTEANYSGTSDDWLYVYDNVYNRTSTVKGSTQTTYTLKTNGLNQYDMVGAASLSYDTNGNLTNDDTNKYIFNCENYMTTLKNQSDTVIAEYTYDWSGRRISKTYNSVTTQYIYDGDHIIAEYQGGSLVRKYIYGPGVDFPIMMINVAAGSETRYYYYRNELGSIIALLNNDGTVAEGYSYDVFGNPRVHTSAGLDGVWLTDDDTTAINPVSAYGNRLMFTAREYDNESGLYYYRARMYHPTFGRFMSPEPVIMHLLRVWAAENNKMQSTEGIYISGKTIQRFIQKDPVGRLLAGTGGIGRYLHEYINTGSFLTLNLYAYVGNNPLNYTDPHGLIMRSIIGGILVPIGLGLIGCPGWQVPGGILVGIGIGLIMSDMIYDPVTDDTVDKCKGAMEDRNRLIDDFDNNFGKDMPTGPPPR